MVTKFIQPVGWACKCTSYPDIQLFFCDRSITFGYYDYFDVVEWYGTIMSIENILLSVRSSIRNTAPSFQVWFRFSCKKKLFLPCLQKCMFSLVKNIWIHRNVYAVPEKLTVFRLFCRCICHSYSSEFIKCCRRRCVCEISTL